jgi:hypothetical protein
VSSTSFTGASFVVENFPTGGSHRGSPVRQHGQRTLGVFFVPARAGWADLAAGLSSRVLIPPIAISLQLLAKLPISMVLHVGMGATKRLQVALVVSSAECSGHDVIDRDGANAAGPAIGLDP